jgi:hypothetical protein
VTAEERWDALKDYLRDRIDGDAPIHREYVKSGDLASAAPFGGLLVANRAALAQMRKLEAGQ